MRSISGNGIVEGHLLTFDHTELRGTAICLSSPDAHHVAVVRDPYRLASFGITLYDAAQRLTRKVPK